MKIDIFRKKVVPEVKIALVGKFPDNLDVKIGLSRDGGYFAEIRNLPGCITQAQNGKELFEMVNDAVYTYLDVPTEYVPFVPTFFPSEEIRKAFDIKIPEKYLKEELKFARN